MKWKAIAIENKPFVVFQTVSNPAPNDPLVVDQLPEYLYGVCTLKIVDGELVARSSIEMEAFENEYNQEQLIRSQNDFANRLEQEYFQHSGEDFPMSAASRIFYDAIKNDTASGKTEYNVPKKDGTLYVLLAAEKAAFLADFYSAVINKQSNIAYL